MASPRQLTAASNPPDSADRRLLRLAYLAPDLQEAIINGTLPPGVTLESILAKPLPVSWARQRALILGDQSAERPSPLR